MSLDEHMVLARIERLTVHDLRLWVSEGWVRPAESETGPVFDEVDVARLRLLCDLSKDMALPEDAMPTLLSLLDNLHRTRRELRLLSAAINDQPSEIRQAILASLEARMASAD
ncbi:chaperone modulatory protein CbpM [Roseivivax lentus]|uniref:Chaperone modulatory protein CbpM n=1 Tax=Roseivivax lentus TaxID=633194 RepID=A0A1N7NYB6_9RHOB|nr:MerR family transcriptional regulator [Roseivivax lentus]SIT03278.1 chaperone modulatory protein CbpM [Roseivivax lentus]